MRTALSIGSSYLPRLSELVFPRLMGQQGSMTLWWCCAEQFRKSGERAPGKGVGSNYHVASLHGRGEFHTGGGCKDDGVSSTPNMLTKGIS